METNERNNSVQQTSSQTDEFITVNLEEQETDSGSCELPSCSEQRGILQKEDQERSKKNSTELPPITERSQEESLIRNEEEITQLENQSSCSCGNSSSNIQSCSQVLPVSDFSPVIISTNPTQGADSTNEEHHGPFHIKRLSPGAGTSIFSFIMTAAFICILWLVVFMVFGYRGHAIAGVFVGLLLIGLLINTCFLKLYLRFKMFLGVSAAVAAAERQQTAIQRRRHKQEKILAEKTKEKPPSYATAVSSPPPYDLLQYYKQRKSTVSMTSFSSRASFYRKGHNCPFCKSEVKVFGICKPCKSSLTKT